MQNVQFSIVELNIILQRADVLSGRVSILLWWLALPLCSDIRSLLPQIVSFTVHTELCDLRVIGF